MSLEDQIKQALDNFENISSEDILEIMGKIQPHFRTKLTSEYLDGKIQKIINENDSDEKKKQCKALIPYFDWYLQGL